MSSQDGSPNLSTIRYCFKFPDGRTHEFAVSINTEKAEYIPQGNLPEYNWTELEFEKCNHCPLSTTERARCPIAVNLASIVDSFKNDISHQNVKILVNTADRTYYKEGPVQDGLYSIFGLIMATSGCPHMNFLKPMALFHLPLATYQDTAVRSTAFYLLGQYFEQKRGGTPDWELKRFEELYKNVMLVNTGIIKRLRSIKNMTGDAEKNAIVALDSFGRILEMELQVDLSGFEPMFKFMSKG